jgi:hypothetical protein
MAELLDVSTWSILQWALVVLVAGFIGQFGKSFAKFLMEKLNAAQKGKTAVKTGEHLPDPAIKKEDEGNDGSAGGGREKALPPAVVGEAPAPTAIAVPAVPQVQKTPPSPVAAGSSAKEEKKLLKAQLKAQKKAAKAANKESS